MKSCGENVGDGSCFGGNGWGVVVGWSVVVWVGVVVYVFGLVGVGLMVSVSGDVMVCCDGEVVSAEIVVCSRAERYVSQEGLGVFVG